MKKTFSASVGLIMILSFLLSSCTNKSEEADSKAKVENTLISVSLLKDTLGYDLEELKQMYKVVNEAIDEIGYPDAGYELWINQDDDADIRFINIGYWPDQEVYDIIHKDQRYIDADDAESGKWDGFERVGYNRFEKFITK